MSDRLKIQKALPTFKCGGKTHKLIRVIPPKEGDSGGDLVIVARDNKGELHNLGFSDFELHEVKALHGLLLPIMQGEQPKRQGDVRWLTEALDAARAKAPDNMGILLVAAPIGPSEDGMRYISNCDRESAIEMLKTLLFQWGEGENWAKHIK